LKLFIAFKRENRANIFFCIVFEWKLTARLLYEVILSSIYRIIMQILLRLKYSATEYQNSLHAIKQMIGIVGEVWTKW
jgi:hypothetical protein